MLIFPNHALLIEAAEALFGPAYKLPLAEALGVNERTLRRWLNGEAEIPPGVWRDLERLAVERRQRLDQLIERLPR